MESTSKQRATLIITTISSFIIPFMGSSINVALPIISREFRLDAVTLSWIATSFILSSAMFLVPFGRVADIYGRKKIYITGVYILTAASLLAAFSRSVEVLILFRVIQGIGSSMMFGTGLAILTSVYPFSERGRVLGINVAAVYIGLSCGPFFGGLLTHYLGWRSIFLATVPLGLIITVLVGRYLKEEWAESRGEKFDLPGSILYGISLVLLMYGFSRLPAPAGIGITGGGVLGIVLFVQWSLRQEHPVLDVRLFRHNIVFALSNLSAMINYSATFAVSFLLSLYLQYIKGMSPQGAGFILVFQPVIMAIFSPMAGRVSDRLEPRIVASAGMSLTALGLLFFVFLTQNTPILVIIAGLVVLGFGFALFSSPNTNAVMSSVERKYYGIASGTIGTMRLIGQMFSMGIAMLIFALYIGRVQITPEYHHLFMKSVRLACLIFAALCFAGIFTSLARGKVRS